MVMQRVLLHCDVRENFTIRLRALGIMLDIYQKLHDYKE
jgi:hypothetical protein